MRKRKEYKLGEITDSCLGNMLDAKKNRGTPQPYLANVNIRWGSFDLDDLPLMRFEESESERYGLKFGNIVVCEGGEPGRRAIWKDQVPNVMKTLITDFSITICYGLAKKDFLINIAQVLQSSIYQVEN